MNETTIETTVEQPQQIGPMVDPQIQRDPVEEIERELGYDELTVSPEDSLENASYLATVAMFGNRMMLEVMQHRMESSKKAVGKDTDGFVVITELMDNIVTAYEDTVNKENFPTKYGNMLEKYGQLGGACKMYMTSHAKARKTNVGRQRMHYIEQISQVVDREMQIIRQYSGTLAKSEEGMTWKEMFAQEGRLELAQRERLHGPKKEAGLAPEAEDSGKAPATGGLEAQVKRLQNQVQVLQDRLDAPKLKVLNQEEKDIWRGVESVGNMAPVIMTADRFQQLRSNTNLEGNELDAAVIDRVAALLEKLHRAEGQGEGAPVFSKRLLRQLMQVCEPAEADSDVMRILARQCRAAQSFQPKALESVQPNSPETELEPQDEVQETTRPPFIRSSGKLDNAGQTLNARLKPQLTSAFIDWSKIRLVYQLLAEHRSYEPVGDETVLDRIESDIILTIGEGRTYHALEELREACVLVRQSRSS